MAYKTKYKNDGKIYVKKTGAEFRILRTIDASPTPTPTASATPTPTQVALLLETSIGSDVVVSVPKQQPSDIGISLNFDSVVNSGVTTVSVINPNLGTPDLPANFVVGDSLASFSINSTANFSGVVVIDFYLPEGISQEIFNSCRIFRVSNGQTTDSTVLNGPKAPDFSTKRISALVDGFSEFYIIPATNTATPTSTATPTPTPTATATPALIDVGYTYNVLNLNYIGSINNSIYGLYYDLDSTPTPTATATPTPTATATPTPTATATPTPTATATPTPTATATPTPTASATPTPTATATPTPTATATPTPTATATPAIQELSVVSGSPSGAGTSASPYLVVSDASPSPIYQANTPGILTVNFTNIRTGNYYCDKRGCETGRYNESVYFDRNDGNFYEQIRTNIDNTTTSTYFGGEALLNRASRNTLTTISYPMHKGQKLRMSQHSNLEGDDRSSPDNNRQLTNARISFTPLNDSNFSISYVGTRGVIGNGTPSNPYLSSTNFSSGQNERTHSFRANGDGIVAIIGWYAGVLDQGNVPLWVPNRPGPNPSAVYINGSSNSFSGSRPLNKLDMFNFIESPYNTITRPNSRFNLFRVTDGQIFSFASVANNKSGSWLQETGVNNFFRPIICCVPRDASDIGIWLMNTNVSFGQATWQPSNTWSGQGSPSSPANMNSFTEQSARHANIYMTMNGTLSFNYEITTGLPFNIYRTFAPGTVGFNAGSAQSIISTISNSSGALSLNIKAFSGINFVPLSQYDEGTVTWSSFKITNLVFSPSE